MRAFWKKALWKGTIMSWNITNLHIKASSVFCSISTSGVFPIHFSVLLSQFQNKKSTNQTQFNLNESTLGGVTKGKIFFTFQACDKVFYIYFILFHDFYTFFFCLFYPLCIIYQARWLSSLQHSFLFRNFATAPLDTCKNSN